MTMSQATAITSTSDKLATEFATELAHFACSLSAEDLPEDALDALKADVFDTLACAAAGSGTTSVVQARELAVTWGGAPQASLLVYGDRVPAHHAAWVNGTMAHARDYDDTHDAAVLHAGVSVIPAALAAAELHGATPGSDFVAGVAAGLETICRLGIATKIGIVESGWMYTPLFGYFAATVAAGRVLGLDAAQLANALGIVYSQTAGNHQVTRDGAQTKAMQPGFAAQSALIAVQLAQRGVRGSKGTFEGGDGFLRVYLQDRFDRKILRDELGARFEFSQLSFKPYPCCRLNHTAIDAARSLRAADGFRVEDIRRVRVGVTKQAYEAVCTPVEVRKAPHTIVHAQFSLNYTVAAALLDGVVGLSHFTEASLQRADILALAQRIDAHVDLDIEREWGRSVTPAHVSIEFEDDRTRAVRVDLPLGHPKRPMGKSDFEIKAADCFGASSIPLQEGAARRLRELVDSLELLADARELANVLLPAS